MWYFSQDQCNTSYILVGPRFVAVYRVKLPAFYLDMYEVTNALFEAFPRENGTDTDDGGLTMVYESPWGLRKTDGGWETQSGYEEYPAVNVSWVGAAQYAKHYGKRLPTQVEWEYACRAGSAGKWCFGDDGIRSGSWRVLGESERTHPSRT